MLHLTVNWDDLLKMMSKSGKNLIEKKESKHWNKRPITKWNSQSTWLKKFALDQDPLEGQQHKKLRMVVDALLGVVH